MATIPYYMNYVIFFQDDAEYAFATSVAGGNLLQMTPRDAAALFDIPFPYPTGPMESVPKGIYFLTPFTVGAQFLFPGASGLFVNDTVLTQIVPGQAGNPASIWPAGPNGSFTWAGNIVRNGGGLASEPAPNTLSQRRFAFGREMTHANDGISGGNDANISRDFSRTIDGCGWSIRGSQYAAFQSVPDIFRVGITPRTSWERVYMRFRKAPTLFETGLWRAEGFPNTLAGPSLKYAVGGAVLAVDISGGGVETSQGTVFTPTLNQWYRFDLLLKYGSGAPPGIFKVYINGTLTFSYNNVSGINANTRHNLSFCGKWSGAAENECEVDFDDWISMDIPANMDATTLSFIDANIPLDWLLGSHVRNHSTDSLTSQTNWTPAGIGKGVLNQWAVPTNRLTTLASALTSTTSGALIEGLSDALPQTVPDSLANVIGAASAIVAISGTNAAGTDGTLGYKKAGGVAVNTTINQTVAEAAQQITYNMATAIPMIVPDEIYPWSIVHNKSADVNSDVTGFIGSNVEYLGVWGPEDDPLFNFPISRLTFIHNAPYGNTPWGYLGSQPEAPCYAVGGTYTGNGTYQEVTLPAPCNFLWIRATPSGTGGAKFFSGAVGPNSGATQKLIPNVRMWYDFLAQAFKFSVVGAASSDVNVNAVVYQYIAFCDPGMRFNLSGAYSHSSSASTPKTNPLIASGFTPLAGFLQQNLDSAGAAEGLYFRGPGSPANQVNGCNTGTVTANGVNFSAGNLNTFASMHASAPWSYSLWRTADSGGLCAGVMVQILSYTGNGSNPRNISLTPTSGRFPLLVAVFPNNATPPYMRDPSHTAANSTQVGSGTNSSIAITGTAIDQITINSDLNTNGVIYNVFAICGGTTNINGSFIGDFCFGDGPYLAPSLPVGDIVVLSDGGITLDGTTPTTILKDISGIYTLVTNQRHDTLYDRLTGQPSVNRAIPTPNFKTGYVGG